MSDDSKNGHKTEGYCFVCKKLSSLKCSNCVKVFYCSANHQREDWKRHKHECRPFEVASNEKFGRYLIASRDIKTGEVLLKESPLIRGPSQITCPVCINCLQGLEEIDINKEQECSQCGWPICLECKNDKRIHHDECEITAARGTKFSLQHYFNPHPTYQCLIVLRCLLLKERSPVKWSQLIQLESHCKERRGSPQWCNDREGVARFIPRFFNCTGRWDEDEMLKVAGIVQINGHEVPLTDPPHVAIYNMASMVEHSCTPNLTKSFTSKADLVFWAPNPIKKGEHLSICYSDALWGTANRQNHQMQLKRSMRWITVARNEKSMGRCGTCNHLVDQAYIRTILDRAASDLEAMDKADENQCMKYIEHYSQWLPPFQLLKLFNILAAAESRCLGALHFELHAALAELGRRGMQNKDNCFRKAIEDSLKNAEETVRYLQHEPIELSEGQICSQTKSNIQSLRVILASTAAPDI